MNKFRFLKTSKRFDEKKYVEVKDLDVIQELTLVESYQKTSKGRVKVKTFIYHRELEMIEEGVLRFLVSIINPYLNLNKFKKQLEKLIKILKEDRHSTLELLKKFKVDTLDELQEKVAYMLIQEAYDDYNKQLQEQF